MTFKFNTKATKRLWLWFLIYNVKHVCKRFQRIQTDRCIARHNRKLGTTWCSLALMLGSYGLKLIVGSETWCHHSQTGRTWCSGLHRPHPWPHISCVWWWFKPLLTPSGSRGIICFTTRLRSLHWWLSMKLIDTSLTLSMRQGSEENSAPL